MTLYIAFCLYGLPFFIISRAAAQATFVPVSRLITCFTFKQLYGGCIILRGRLGNYPDSLNFILDTGSGGISLDSSTASDLKMDIVPSEITVAGIAGRSKAPFLYAQQLKLPGLTIEGLNFHITDYGILTSFYGEKIDGIIGYPVLRNYIVELDYDSSLIRFYSRGSVKYPEGGYLLKPYINYMPFQAAVFKDARKIQSNFLFDIGANVCLMISADFDKDSLPVKTSRKRFTKEAEGVGGKILMQTTVIREFKLGPYKFTNVPVCIFDDSFNVTSYPYSDGIIGNELLRRFNIILNYGNKEIFLKPNGHFGDFFDYNYTGIELYFAHGVTLIGDVTAGSPASKAGLKEGDIILAVGNVFSQSLSVLKDALSKANGNVKIIVVRSGAVRQFQFRITSIL